MKNNDVKTMRILLGYSHFQSPTDKGLEVKQWLTRLHAKGMNIDGFCLTLKPPGPYLRWPELNNRWHSGDTELLTMYENLARKLENYDVFLNYNGINLHPDFVQQLPTFNVFSCFDDPESSDNLSRPVAWAYDLAMVGNIAALDAYRDWGVKEVQFWPLGFRMGDYDPTLTREQILEGQREITVTLLCERRSSWRNERLDRFSKAFPEGEYWGFGWPKGFLPAEQRIPLYQRTKIGINLHNSTGPINLRTYMLPANGVMQLCDNKLYLGQIFNLNKEVVGFNTIEEAIELCQYYLNNDYERRQIAAAGWERTIRDYNEVAVFNRLITAISNIWVNNKKQTLDTTIFLQSHHRNTALYRRYFSLRCMAGKRLQTARNIILRMLRRNKNEHSIGSRMQ